MMILNRNQSPRLFYPPRRQPPPPLKKKPKLDPFVLAYVPIPPPSRFKRFLRSVTRWGSVALLGFLVGIAVMAYPLLQAQASLKSAEKERDQGKFTLAVQSKLLTSLQSDQRG